MLSLILLVVAFILFLVAAANESLFDQGPADLVAFGLAAWVLAVILSGLGPASPIKKGE